MTSSLTSFLKILLIPFHEVMRVSFSPHSSCCFTHVQTPRCGRCSHGVPEQPTSHTWKQIPHEARTQRSSLLQRVATMTRSLREVGASHTFLKRLYIPCKVQHLIPTGEAVYLGSFSWTTELLPSLACLWQQSGEGGGTDDNADQRNPSPAFNIKVNRKELKTSN